MNTAADDGEPTQAGTCSKRRPRPLDQLGRAWEATGNPVFAWLALNSICNFDDYRSQPLPAWLVTYLRDASSAVMALALGHAQFSESLPRAEQYARAVGFIGEKTNAAAEYRQLCEELEDLRDYTHLARMGVPVGDIIEQLADRGGHDLRSVQRRLTRARSIFTTDPAASRVVAKRRRRRKT